MMNENKPGVYKLHIPFFTKLGERSERNGIIYTKEPIVKAIEKMKHERENIFVTLGRDNRTDDPIKQVTIDLETIVGTMESYDDEGIVVAIKSKAKYYMVENFVELHGYCATISMTAKIVDSKNRDTLVHAIDSDEIPKIICIDILPPRKETEK